MNVLEKLAERAPELAFELPDGTTVVKLGLIATLYFKEGYTAKNKQKVMECFDRFYNEFGSELKGQFQEKYKKLTPENFKKNIEKILKSGPNEQYEWQVTSAKNVKEVGVYSLSVLNTFELHGDAMRSYIKLVLPWELLRTKDGSTRFHDWLTYLCNQITADHGYGGLSTILPYDYHSYMPIEYEMAQQYSGLDVDSMAHASTLELIDYIKGVNWYTIIGNAFVERLGGESAIRHAFSGRGDIEILTYKNGLIIRAGEYPELGAMEDGAPAAYVAVNKVVKPVRIPNPDQLHSYSPYGNCFEKDSTDRWYARFDQEETG